MRLKANELSQIISRFAQPFLEKYQPNSFIIRTLDALQKCRTSAFGGHIERCDCCGHQRISYNSCRNRHCPKCQAAKQAFWVEDRMKDALEVGMLSTVFRGKMLGMIKRQLNNTGQLSEYQSLLDKLWSKPWVVNCEGKS
jgi:hypothetical protein